MASTYINDNKTLPYPFYGLDALPFPNSYIVGLGLCVKNGTYTGKFYISSIEIGAGSFTAVVCSDSGIVGQFYKSAQDRASVILLQQSSGVTASGFLVLGTIPEQAHVIYTGVFVIDPKCITHIPSSVYGNHTQICVDGVVTDLGQSLTILPYGCYTLLNETLSAPISPDDASDYMYITAARSYDIVTTVNGINALTASETQHGVALNINTQTIGGQEDAIEVAVRELPAAVIIQINGTSTFPNCYQEQGQQ